MATAKKAAPAPKSTGAKAPAKTATKSTTKSVTKAPANKNTGKTAAAPAVLKPFKDTLTKSALLNHIAEQNELSRKQASAVLSTIENLIMGSIHPKGAGEFSFPGLMRITLRKVPARKAGTMIRNPSTGEMMPAAAKPASVRVKIRPLSKLKSAATA